MSDIQYWTESMEKQVGYRVSVVLNDPRLLSVYQKFGGELFRRSSIFHGLDEFLRRHRVRGKTCFEVGTWNALTSVVLSRYFEEVVTVDVVRNPVKHAVLAHLDITNVRCVDLASNADKPAAVKALKGFDFAYLDGNHADDTETDFELVRRCGRVLFHEAWPHQEPVWKLVHRLPPEQVRFGGICFALWTRP